MSVISIISQFGDDVGAWSQANAVQPTPFVSLNARIEALLGQMQRVFAQFQSEYASSAVTKTPLNPSIVEYSSQSFVVDTHLSGASVVDGFVILDKASGAVFRVDGTFSYPGSPFDSAPSSAALSGLTV
jgi:hypothetical protein